MDEKSEIIMREWEQRYESYREYRKIYYTLIGLTITGYFLLLSLAFGFNIGYIAKIIILAFLMFFVTLLVIVNMVGNRGVNQLGERINELEKELGMREFDTVGPLRKALVITKIIGPIVWIITFALTLYAIFADV